MSSDFRGVPLPAASKVGWEWGAPDNRKQIQIPKPHMGFYRTMPSTSLCLLSAPNSQRTFTHCDPPPRPCMTWDDSQVQTMVGSMRKRRESLDPRHEMIRPCVWEDLYHYFHAVDLWRMGAWNLWRVVHRLVDEVEGVISSPPLSQKELKEIEEWVWRWCTHEKNRERLGRWNEMADVISVLSPRDIKNVRWCEWQVLEVLRGELKYWFPLYKTPDAEPEPESKGKQVAKDDIPQVPSQIAPSEGRPRRRSNSLRSVPPNDAQGTAGFVYTANPVIVIVNGTTMAPPQLRGLTADQRGLADGVAGWATRKGHHPSKSGPLPAVAAGPSLATRGAGVEGSGPSRLPRAALRPAEPAHSLGAANTAGGNGVCCRAWRRNGPSRTATFAVCWCNRCSLSSRSVYVAPIRMPDDVRSERMREILGEFFARWGHVKSCDLKCSNPRPGMRSPYFAFVRFNSEVSALKAVAELGGQPLDFPYLLGAQVSHPFNSRHYNNVQQPWRGVSSNPSPPDWAQTEKNASDGDPGPSNRPHLASGQQQQPQQPQQQLAVTYQSLDDVRNSSSSTSGPAVPPPNNQTALKPGNTGAALPSGPYQLPPRPPSECWHHSPTHHGPWFSEHQYGWDQPSYPPFPPHTQMPMPHGPHHQGGWGDMSMAPPDYQIRYGPLDPPPYHPGHSTGFPYPDHHFNTPRTPHSHGPHFQGRRSQPRAYPSRTRPSGMNNIPAPVTRPSPLTLGTFAQTRQLPGTETSKQTSPPAGIEIAGSAQPPVATEAPTQAKPTPGPGLSIQTKRPSDEAVFDEDAGLQPPRPSTALSSTSNMSIRIRLPSVFANPAGEGPSTAPGASNVEKENSPSDSPRVNLPYRDHIPDDSPVRRITFGDFGRPDAMPPVLQRTQPPSPTPQPRAQSTVPSQSSMLVNASEREFSQGPSRRPSEFLSNRNPGDIRLDEDYTGTVIRRRPRGNAGRLPWNEQQETGYAQQAFRRGNPPAPPRHGPSGTFHPPSIDARLSFDARPSFGGPAHQLNEAPRPSFGGQLHPQKETPPTPFNGQHHQQFHGQQQSFNAPAHHGQQQSFNALAHHGPPHQSFRSPPHQAFHGQPHQSFHDPSPSLGEYAPPFQHQYPHLPNPFHGPVPNLHPQPFHGSGHGPSPPQGFNNTLRSPPYQQPPPSFPLPQPPTSSPSTAGLITAPQPPPFNPTDWNKNTANSQKKRQAKAKARARHTMTGGSRGPSPLPLLAATGTDTDQASVTTSTRGKKGKGKGKGKAKAQARPATPAGSEFVGGEDVYNATPRKVVPEGEGGGEVVKDKEGEGSGEGQGQGSGAQTQGQGSGAQTQGQGSGAQTQGQGSDARDQGQGVPTQSHPHAHPPGHVWKPSDKKGDNKSDKPATNKKGGKGPNKKKKATPPPLTSEPNKDAPLAGPSNKPEPSSSNKAEQEPNKQDEEPSKPEQNPTSSAEPAGPAGPAGEPASEPTTTEPPAEGSSSTPAYRANAGGSLHVQRHRKVGSKASKRGDVRDLFKEEKE